MFSFAEWGKRFQDLIGDLTMEVRDLAKKLSSMSRTDIEKELAECTKVLQNGSDEFLKARKEYKVLIQTYFRKFPPHFSEECWENLRQYHELIGHSSIIGSADLLDEWGIKYLRTLNLQWINNPSEKQDFVKGLYKIKVDHPGVDTYFDHLIQQF